MHNIHEFKKVIKNGLFSPLSVMQFLCDHKMDIPDIVPLSPPADSPSSSGPPAKKARTSVSNTVSGHSVQCFLYDI